MYKNLKDQIERVEPPFWYAGMENPELQIMFYGKGIAKHQVSVSNGVTITNVKRTENLNYIFITIDTKNVAPSCAVFSFKNNGKEVFTQLYSLKQRKENSAQRKSFDSSDVIYLLMPDRFAIGKTNKENATEVTEKYNRASPGGRHGGDIYGIIKNLDYISSLGVTAIWSTPLCEDNDPAFSYHGYGQSDVYKIDPRFRSNADYAR